MASGALRRCSGPAFPLLPMRQIHISVVDLRANTSLSVRPTGARIQLYPGRGLDPTRRIERSR